MKQKYFFILFSVILVMSITPIPLQAVKKIEAPPLDRGVNKLDDADQESSQNLKACTLLDTDFYPQKNLGQSLEQDGFILKSKKDIDICINDDFGWTKCHKKTYGKNGISVEYAYFKNDNPGDELLIKFPNISEQEEFLDNIYSYGRQCGIELDRFGDTIEFGWGQIQIEDLEVNFIWL